MSRAEALPLLLLLGACAMTFEEAHLLGVSSQSPALAASASVSVLAERPRDKVRCASLSDQHRSWSVRNKTFVGLAGAQGVALIPSVIPDAADRWKGILAGGAAFFGVLAFFSNVQAESYAASWAKECS